MSSIRKKIGRSRPRARWLEQWPAPILLHSSESIRGVTLAYFPFVLSRKEYAEARKSRRCREAERLAQAQVQTTPPWSKAGRSEMKHHSWCCPRLATPFTCLVSCSIHPPRPFHLLAVSASTMVSINVFVWRHIYRLSPYRSWMPRDDVLAN